MKTTRIILLVFAAAILACGDNTDDGGPNPLTAGDVVDSSDSICDGVGCSNHGTCVVMDGVAACDCDEGYLQGFRSCIDIDPQPPIEFSCPNPSDADDSLFQALTANPWYFAQNDRTCTVSAWLLYRFGGDGVFTLRFQADLDSGPVGGALFYGCYTFSRESDDRFSIDYNFDDNAGRNCGLLGGLDDPPCQALLEQVDTDTLMQASSFDANDEQLLFRRADPSCGWCSDDASCCPLLGWVADSSGLICE
jgi:hypothetical protein